VFTAHNIDARQRDGGNNAVNRLSLRFSYRLMDHIFVHTEKMKTQLVEEFNVTETKITIIPHGILNTAPDSGISKSEARSRLQLDNREKVLLFFGYIAPYKGLEYLIHALDRLRSNDESFRLIIAGQIKDCPSYWKNIKRLIEELDLKKYIIMQIRHIPDNEVEVFFKASDALVLPYTFIFQSGVPFLSYSFGLPVIATDVGSLREVIVEGITGMMCRKEDPADLADKIRVYFQSELYGNLEDNMKKIKSYGNEKYSWDRIGATIHGVYDTLLA
jgi:glycosyltransferase involved in cell wall biosynthesis